MTANWSHEADRIATTLGLCRLAHEIWAEWCSYMLAQGARRKGAVTIPAEVVERWERQMAARYDDLSPQEQASDQIIALRWVVEMLK